MHTFELLYRQNQHSFSSRLCSTDPAVPIPPFHAVVLYENEALRVRARRICDRLASVLPPVVPLRREFSDCNLLSDVDLTETLCWRALSCHLVIIGTNGSRGMPAVLQHWLDLLTSHLLYRLPLALVTKETVQLTPEIWEAAARYLHRLSDDDWYGASGDLSQSEEGRIRA